MNATAGMIGTIVAICGLAGYVIQDRLQVGEELSARRQVVSDLERRVEQLERQVERLRGR